MGNRIRAERAMAKVSQAQLAEELGLTTPTLRRYENNIDSCPVGLAKQIAEYFDCSIDYIIGVSETRR